MKKSWSEYLKRLANDKVSNLLLSIMFLFDAVHFAFIEDSKIFLYISFLPLVLDIIWCDVVLYKRDIHLSKATNNILKYLTYAVCLAIAVIVIIGAINKQLTEMKRITKDELSFVISSFIIWSIIEIVIDLITGVTLAEMLSVKYIVCYLAGALGFALVFTLIFKVLNLFPDKKKK